MAQNLIFLQDNAHISDNLLPVDYSFDVPSNFTNVSGSGAVTFSNIRYAGTQSLSIINFLYQTADYSFWITDKEIVPLVNGKVLFSLFVNSDNTENVNCAIEMYFGGVLAETYNFTIDIVSQPYTSTSLWKRYVQTFSTYIGQDVTFKFILKHNPDSIFSEKSILIDGLKLEQDNKGFGFPTSYLKPVKNYFEWQSRVDTTNTQSLTANTNNVLGFLGISETSSADTNILADDGLIIPSKVGNVITIDYSFILITPSGTDRFVDVNLICDGITYRGQTYTLIHGSGNNQYISGSFTLPVGQLLFDQNAKIYVNPNSNCSINTRYISVVEHSNPIS
jgi:hypothetical protein